MTRSYEIDAHSAEIGGGWTLRLLEHGEEVGSAFFPPVSNFRDAYLDLMDVAYDFIENSENSSRDQQEK